MAIVGAVVVLVPALVEYVSFSDQFTYVRKNEFGLREYRHDASGIVLVLIPGGTFLMGSPEDEPGRRDDEWQHVVSLSSFLIGRHEVTQGEWVANGGKWNPRIEVGERSPTFYVSWDDARRFVDALGLHLPTEAQWEYACRAGTTGRFHRELDSVGWYASNQGPDLLSDVAMKRPNGFGLYDMHGNAFEWCEDKYDEHSAVR